MFESEIKKDSKGKLQKNFFLTQGDTANIKSVPKQNGELIDVALVSKCVFKLSLDNYKELFCKELFLQDDKFMLRLESEETAKLAINTYIYEIEYTFIDGTVNTPNKGEFTIEDQIVK